MSTMTIDHQDRAAVRTARRVVTGAIACIGIALLAGLALLVLDPAQGSTIEAAFGLTAAIGGLGFAVFAIAALIYAQAKNLWRYAPMWVRVLAWGVILAGLTLTLVNLFRQSL